MRRSFWAVLPSLRLLLLGIELLVPRNTLQLLLILTKGANAQQEGQDIGGLLANTSNFLDSGLATLGALSAWVNSTVKGRFDFEIGLREATYVSHYNTVLSPVENLSAFMHVDWNDLLIPFAVFRVGECHYMEKVFAWWVVNRTEATVETVICSWYSEESECSHSPASSQQLHACRCLLIPSSFVDRHSLWQKDDERCTRYDNTQALLHCADCMASRCHGLPVSPATTMGDYWKSITDCLDNLHHDAQHGALILADADSSLETLHFLRRCAISGDESARHARTPILDLLYRRDNCDSLSFGKLVTENNSWRYGILCGVEALIQLALVVTLHLDALTAGLVARRMLRSYVGDSTGTGSTLELLFPKMHIGTDGARVFAAGFPVKRNTLWRFAITLCIRFAGTLFSLALWCYLILTNNKKLFYSNAYTTPPAVWVVCYSSAIAAIQAATGCMLGYHLRAAKIRLRRSLLLLVAITCAAQVSYSVVGIVQAAGSKTPIRWRLLIVALEMVITFHWFVSSILLRNNPRTTISSNAKLISLWYSFTFLQLSAITTMGGKWK